MESYAKADGFDMTWLISQALMNSLCLQGQEEESLEENCLDGEPSAPSSGNPTQQAYCAPDKMTKFSRLSRYGMIVKPLTETRGEELLTLYLEDFRARTSRLQETGQDWTESDQECGEKWHGLLARFDQDTHSWRTVQCSLIGDLNESLQTLPAWGMTVGGELYLRQTLVQTIKEKESGYWLTPSTVDIPVRSQESMEKRLEYRAKIGRNGVAAGCLSEQVTWSKEGLPISYMTTDKFPTPKAQDSRHALNRHINSKDNHWKSNLGEVVSAQVNGGYLNPNWVEWLMNWPITWSSLNAIDSKEYQRWKETSTKTF
jgi:hypothetical protein